VTHEKQQSAPALNNLRHYWEEQWQLNIIEIEKMDNRGDEQDGYN
jgi:hypothetical protein